MPDTAILASEMEPETFGGYPVTDATKIEQRPDGSFVLDGIYHVASDPEFDDTRKVVAKLVAENPDRLIVLPKPTEAELAAMELASCFINLRAERDRRLAATDFAMMPDYPVSEDVKEELLAYRQALRDLPGQEGAPFDGGGSETAWPDCPIAIKA